MTWYKTGTVAVTAGSNAVIGTGTSFIANSRVGDGFRGPDGGWYEITNIASDTAMSIAPAYGDPSAYSIAPLQGYLKDSADALRATTMTIAGGVADMEEQVAVATEAAESAAQSKAGATEQASIATSAAATSTNNKDAAQLAAQQSSSSAQTSGAAADRAETAKTSIIQSEQAATASAAAAAESAEQAEAATVGKAASGDNNDITSLRAMTADGFDRIRQGLAPLVGATASVAGTKGLVPAPSIADRLKVLSGAGTWVALPAFAWGSITGALSAQTDLQSALNNLADRASSLEYGYTSPAQTYVAGGTITLMHNLGSMPRRVTLEVACVVAEGGYSVGDVVLLGEAIQTINSSNNAFGVSIRPTTTQVNVLVAIGGLTVVSRSSGGILGLTPANWRMTIKASKS
ncbi:hypothetical protein [Pseudomonas grimontii]|uniref:hypothetical protein n=1 Tax=Pseudomonas grimontii TaxID=129847 RepID=UPI0028E75F14|nr:hypothetical protein [Pseudomonas grimontii]